MSSIQPSAVPRSQPLEKISKKGSDNNQDVDVMMLAVYYLLQSASITCKNELIRSKSLNQNAQSQELLNQIKENFLSVPSEKVSVEHITITNVHWTWRFWVHSGFRYKTYQHETVTNIKNQGEIDQVQAINQQVSGIRQIMSDKQNILSQEAQVKATGISTESDLTSQIIQMGGSMLQIIQTLSFNASLRQPVQG